MSQRNESAGATTGPQGLRGRAIVVVLAFVAALLGVMVSVGAQTAHAAAFTARVMTGGSNLNIRSGPSTGYSVLRQLANGTYVGINCYVRGQSITGYYGTTDIWDAVDGGGWASDAYLYTGSNNPVVPLCGSTPAPSTREQRAVGWANSQLGSTAYNGWCERFVENAYGTAHHYASALSAFYGLQSAGMMHYNSTGIPAGALVFDRNPYDQGYGHVILSRGDGSFVSPQSTVRVVYNPALSSATGYRFLGWSYAPSGWPGV